MYKGFTCDCPYFINQIRMIKNINVLMKGFLVRSDVAMLALSGSD
jgi:hypothetical protein